MPLRTKPTAFRTSGEVTTTGGVAVATKPGILAGVHIITDGTNDVLVTIYDDPDSANGNKLLEHKVAGGDNNEYIPKYTYFNTGMWAVITGSGGSIIVDYTLVR